MINRRRLVPRVLVAAVAAFGLLVASAPAMAGSSPGGLEWGACADPDAAAAGWQCATFKAPKDYSNPTAGHVKIAVTRLPAAGHGEPHRPLFTNPGGPGGSAMSSPRATRICSPRSTTTSTSSPSIRAAPPGPTPIDCKVNQETDGVYAAPFTRPRISTSKPWWPRTRRT